MEQYVITFDEIRALLAEQQYSDDDITELEKAFEFARKNGKKNVTIVTKANIVKLADGNFRTV